MPLELLIFDASDDGHGQGSWEALASVKPERLPALRAEVERVLQAAESHAPGPRGPAEAGGLWDAELQWQQEGAWTSVTLTLTGPWDWGEALLAELAGDGAPGRAGPP